MLLLGIGILVWLTLVVKSPLPLLADPDHVRTSAWGALYDSAIPPGQIIFAAIVVALGAAGFVALIELRASDRARCSITKSTYPLSPRILSAKSRGHFSGDIAITVFVPAHNEHEILNQCLDQLKLQLRPQDRIIVISDNSTDGTSYLARVHGLKDSKTIVERVIAACQESPLVVGETSIPVHLSAGLADWGESENFDKALANADSALYAAKHRGGSCAEMFEPTQDSSN